MARVFIGISSWADKSLGVSGDEKFKYLYQEDELKEWLPRVNSMAHEADELHIIFKNKYSDFPVRNARQFSRLLGSETDKLTI